jgi:hypothetical protein
MNEERNELNSPSGSLWRCLNRLVRWFGPTSCCLGMMLFILMANSRAAGVDALFVAFFAMGYGFLKGIKL